MTDEAAPIEPEIAPNGPDMTTVAEEPAPAVTQEAATVIDPFAPLDEPAPPPEVEHAASEPVTLEPEAPEAMPASISDKVPMERHAQTIARVETFLAEARYFISTLTHEVDGDAGEIIAWLKARL